MRQPYKTPIAGAQADIKVPEPRVSKAVIVLLKLLGRLYLFLFYGIARIVLQGDKGIFDAFQRALTGKSRCIIAFRHPNGGEPQLLTWFFLFRLRSLAARQGVKLARQPHAVFVYGYEVVRWGGWIARLILPRVGGMPVHHSKMDRRGMARIYRAIIEGPYPLALAPEGQVSYNADIVPRLEQGTMRIGFHAAERLAAQDKNIPLEILPVAIHYRFGTWGILTAERLLRKIEKYVSSGSRDKNVRKLPFAERIRRCREFILETNEKRYNIQADKTLPFEDRLNTVIEAALESAERILNVKSEGDFFTRMYSLRQICWDHMILPGVDSLDKLSGVEQGVLDLKAGEAWHASRHLELIDFSWYFRIPLPQENASLHNKIEYVQNLWDFVNRTIGGAYSDRVSILPRRVVIVSAPVIDLSDRLPVYRQDKNAAIEAAMKDLEAAYLDCVKKVNYGE